MEDVIGKYKSLNGVNEVKHFNIDIESSQNVLPAGLVETDVDAYERYYIEKDASTIYRIICTIKPVCSNVLYNNITEIVSDEGSDDCKVYDSTTTETSEYGYKDGYVLNRYNLIRDTAFSHPDIGGLVYHCGSDIFNNHVLRQESFSVVNKTSDGTVSDVYFNTIDDWQRDNNGNNVSSKELSFSGNTVTVEDKLRHLYSYFDVKTYIRAAYDGLVENNGWFGFINKANVEINNVKINDKEICVNKCMNNNKACEQIDFYPDRSLYSFIPKINKKRKRVEKNWETIITYPYSSETIDILEGGLQCEFDNISQYKVGGDIRMFTYIRNSFNVGDIINLYYETDGEMRHIDNIRVSSVGTNDGNGGIYYFSFKSSIILDKIEEISESNNIRVVKNVNGVECQYYVRKFKKIGEINTTVNKLAFSNTYYGDGVSQVIFNDDIDIEGLKDNLGRPLTEMYLTIVKTNYGHDEWYNDKNYSDEAIEFSHCFGKVSSGFDLLPDVDDYNIHKIHNIDVNNIDISYINESPKALEEDIDVRSENAELYGDIVEFYPDTLEEVKLEDVYHRFNTMQREIISEDFTRYSYDEVINDDFNELPDTSITSGITTKIESPEYINLNPEGYYYKPHYRIALREFAPEVYTIGDGEKVRQLLSSKDYGTSDELFDSVFTNGAHYRYENINFYLKRQDPKGYYDMLYTVKDNVPQFVKNLVTDGLEKDVSSAEYSIEEVIRRC